MIIFTEKPDMQLAFNKILKEEVSAIHPCCTHLFGKLFADEVLQKGFQ